MADELDLIIQAINKVQDDVKYIRDKTDIHTEKIQDLCQRTTWTEEEIKKEINTRVKNETSKYKFITIVFSGLGGVVSAITTLKSMWH